MVTGIEIAVMLDCHCPSAGLPENAKPWLHSIPAFQGHIEHPNKIPGHIAAHPLIENRAKELPKLQGLHGPLRNLGGTFPGRTDQVKPIGTRRFRGSLHNRYELHVTAARLAQKAVHFERMIGILAMHDCQGVEVNVVLL